MAFATTASAQNYPSGPVKLIVPVPAGGVTDVMARIVGQRLQELWGQTVVVENRPGGNYGVGAQAVERAPADGLTLLVAPDSTFTANPALFSKLIYDPDAFTPIAVLCRATPMLMVNPSLPVKSVSEELVAYAKANPGKLSYGSFGTGTYAHLSMEDSQATHRDGHPARSVSGRSPWTDRATGQRSVGHAAQSLQRRGACQDREGAVDRSGNGQTGRIPA